MSLSTPEKLLELELVCPICLHLYKDPVYLPCGHNYCLACIQKAPDVSSGEKSLCRCPECREEYSATDTLPKNLKLCSIIEGYKATAPKDRPMSGPLTVPCDHCLDPGTLAVKTCLKCEVSLCVRHLHRHSERQSFQSHALVDPQTMLGTAGCEIHGRMPEYFCANDATSLCATCFVKGTHHNHHVLTIEAAEEEMRKTLESRSTEVTNRLKMTETLLESAVEEQRRADDVGDKTSDPVAVIDKMAELVGCYRDRIHQLLKEGRSHQRERWRSELELLEKQQQQLKEAQQSSTEVLTVTEKVLFIHKFLLIEPQLKEVVTGPMVSMPSLAPLNTRIHHANLKMEDFKTEMSQLLHQLNVSFNPLELTFNIDTAHPSLLLSTDLQTVKYSSTKQNYADNLERFSTAPQVLCSQGFSSGQHTWVVELGEQSMWSVGLCYNSIPRKGDHSRLGHNATSWRLQWKNKKLSACHASSSMTLTDILNQPLRVEVVLDYERGTLVFYSTKFRREQLHTFRAVFTEAVYPAFSIHSNTPESWITLQSGL